MMNWPVVKELVETDVPTETFNQKLEEARITLDEALLEWRNNFEQALIKKLPKEPTSSETEDLAGGDKAQPVNPSPEYILVASAGLGTQAMTSLPLDLQQLLRADSVYMRRDKVYFYPDDFCYEYIDDDSFVYEAQPAKIVKALLASLGLRDATYLEMKAAGRRFVCGRCYVSRRMSWKDMVSPLRT
jgi:hypothetical protein